MKYIAFPLFFLVFFSLLSQLGLGTQAPFGDGEINVGNLGQTGYFDEDGHQVLNLNFTAVGESGDIEYHPMGLSTTLMMYWKNVTGTYQLFDDDEASEQSVGGEVYDSSFSLNSSLGVIGIILAVMVVATVAGIQIVGSGENTFSIGVIVLGGVYLSLWGVFSVLSMALIIQLPIFGVILYFLLTLMYTIGIIKSFKGESD